MNAWLSRSVANCHVFFVCLMRLIWCKASGNLRGLTYLVPQISIWTLANAGGTKMEGVLHKMVGERCERELDSISRVRRKAGIQPGLKLPQKSCVPITHPVQV